MRKVGKLLSASVVVSTLVVGSSAAFITTSGPEAQAAEQVQKWGHGEGAASGASTQGASEEMAQTPWYNYYGYTTYDPSFTQDYNFVRALKYDNVSIDNYKVDPKAYKNYDHSIKVYDTTVDFNDDNEVIKISFNTKPNTVTKETFKKHMLLMIWEEKVIQVSEMVQWYIIILMMVHIRLSLMKMIT